VTPGLREARDEARGDRVARRDEDDRQRRRDLAHRPHERRADDEHGRGALAYELFGAGTRRGGVAAAHASVHELRIRMTALAQPLRERRRELGEPRLLVRGEEADARGRGLCAGTDSAGKKRDDDGPKGPPVRRARHAFAYALRGAVTVYVVKSPTVATWLTSPAPGFHRCSP